METAGDLERLLASLVDFGVDVRLVWRRVWRRVSLMQLEMMLL
jgi:hypothetical protein